ncbi:MAG: glycosyltransferase [Alphaproteobacteria bacterium]|nr:glycosyltransferase [Alphaproteobacteria bacterium]
MRRLARHLYRRFYMPLREAICLRERINRLEILLAEHPDVMPRGLPEPRFPSPAVSVIMPVWNRGALVVDAIRSVQAQRFTDWELIIVDDGSTDNTPETIATFTSDARIRYVSQPHAGQSTARNHALRLSKGALIAYLDSDNVWYPGFLAGAVSVFATDPSCDCAYGAMVTEAHLPEGQRILFEKFSRKKLRRRNFIGMSTFIHRRSLYERHGGFDEALRSLEDWDLVLRYTQEKPAIRVPFLAVRYRSLDAHRVTLTESLEAGRNQIRRKWR